MDKKAKTLVLCLLWIMCFTFAACDPAPYGFQMKDKESVESVRLIRYNNDDVREVRKKTDVLSLDFDKIIEIEALKKNKFDKFYKNLTYVLFHESDNISKYTSAPSGICIMITYKNGNITVFCCNKIANFLGEYDQTGAVCGVVGYVVIPESFSTLVNIYFDAKITESGTIFRSWE